MKPVIGITSRYSSQENKYNLPDAYTKAIQRNGGTPIILPPLYNAECQQLYDLCDGVLFTGGPDVDPILYGEQPLPGQGWIEPMRDEFEFELAKIVLDGPKPFLGICRGLQTLNAAAGGTLIQDIASQVEKTHQAPSGKPRRGTAHTTLSWIRVQRYTRFLVRIRFSATASTTKHVRILGGASRLQVRHLMTSSK